MIDPGLGLRALVVAALVGGELACALTAPRREDGTYGLARPPPGARYTLALVRETPGGGVEPVGADGTWLARDAGGTLRRVRFADRVRERALATLGQPVGAPWGRERTLRFLQAALDDVAAATPEDAETVRLRLAVTFDDGTRTEVVGAPFPGAR